MDNALIFKLLKYFYLFLSTYLRQIKLINMLSNTTFLITGIADKNSLAMYVAKEIIKQGGKVICTGLGVSPHHSNLSDKAKAFLEKNFQDFKQAVTEELGDGVLSHSL